MRVINGQIHRQDNDLMTLIDNAGGVVIRHMPYGNLRSVVKALYEDAPDEVLEYIEEEWDLRSDDYLNVKVVDDEDYEE